MKYLLLIFSLSFYSCKQEYECCWYIDEEVQENVGFCTVNKMTKKESDNSYVQVNDLEWKCNKK